MANKFISNIELDGNIFELVLVGEEEIKDFFSSELKKHKEEGTENGNAMYLSYSDSTFALMDVIGLSHNGVIVAFCLRPRYAPTVACRLYTSPDYRCYGLATYLLDWSGIKSLACMIRNKTALKFYKNLGFKVVQEFSELVNLERD